VAKGAAKCGCSCGMRVSEFVTRDETRVDTRKQWLKSLDFACYERLSRALCRRVLKSDYSLEKIAPFNEEASMGDNLSLLLKK
jgi:hypothetical protein